MSVEGRGENKNRKKAKKKKRKKKRNRKRGEKRAVIAVSPFRNAVSSTKREANVRDAD